MQEVPTWWLAISAIFFIINTLFFVALIVVVIKLMPVLQQMTQKIGDLTTKVEKVAEKVEEVATHLGEVAGHLGETVGNVGQKATGILGSIELITQSASRQFERFSPLLVGAMTTMRLVKALNEMKSGKPTLEATKGKTLTKKAASSGRKKLFGIL